MAKIKLTKSAVDGERRKPALGQYGELTVEQARSLAQEWLALVRRGGDPGAAKAEACMASATVRPPTLPIGASRSTTWN